MSEHVLRIVGEHFDVPSEGLTPETNLEELGGDSIDPIELIKKFEDELWVEGVEFDNIEIPEWPTVEHILDSVNAHTLKSSTP